MRKIFPVSMGVLLACAGVWAAAQPAATAAAKKPTLAVLPFVPASGGSRDGDLAERLRFAVSQKLSSDMNAVAASGAYDRLDNVQVDQVASALEVSFVKAMPDEEEMQKLLATLDTRFAIAGVMKGRQATLTLYENGVKGKSVMMTIPPESESPKLAVEKALTELTGTAFAHIRDVEADHSDAKVEGRWASRPNLVADPGFEEAVKAGKRTAASWEALLGPELYAPLVITANDAANLDQDMVAVVPKAVAGAAGDGNCLMMRMSKKVAENNGLACESEWIPVEMGKTYRFAAQYHSTGPTVRVFLKGFGEKADQYSDAKKPETVRREFYRAQVLPREKNAGWEMMEMDFTPSTQKATDPKIQWVRVDLFIYLKPGDVFFDDVVVKKIEE